MAPPLWSESWPTDHPDYPRRRMQRREWQSLNGPWQFAVAAGCRAPERHPRRGTARSSCRSRRRAPPAASTTARWVPTSGIAATIDYTPARRRAAAAALRRGRLPGEGVGRRPIRRPPRGRAHPVHVRHHRRAQGPRASTRSRCGRTTSPQGLAQPRGKQDWQDEPHSIWYPRTTGIWQTVWLEEVPRRRLSDVRLTPHLDRWAIGFEARLDGPDRGEHLRVRLRLSVGERVLADDLYDVQEEEVHRRIALADPGHRRLAQRAALVAGVADADPGGGVAARRRRR